MATAETNEAGAGLQAFQREQMRFAAAIRNPDQQPRPDSVDARRMNLYVELFYNNASGSLSTAFPVIRKLFAEERWAALVRDFLIRHRSVTPLFAEISEEFLAFLNNERDNPSDPPFLRELAHYEWVELAVAVGEDETDLDGIDRNGDLMAGVPVISDVAWPLAYQFDVQNIGPEYQPEQPPEQPTYLIVFRDREDEVRFSEINPVTYRLLELLESEENMTGEQAAVRIADELQHADPAVVVAGAQQILDDLREREIIVGSRAA